MANVIGRLIGAAVISLSLANVATAGPLTSDPAALGAWQGSTVFNGSNLSATHTLTAVVDFAVYQPGNFSLSAALGNPVDVSGGAEYIYAYEVFRLGNDAAVNALSISLFPGAVPNNSVFVGHDATTPEGGIAPVASNFVPGGLDPKTNVRWNFVPAIGGTDHSDILYFASPFGPQLLISTVGGTFVTAGSALLPSPVPEPSTCVLVAVGTVSFLVVRRRQKRAP
jgi:hypothetical protein